MNKLTIACAQLNPLVGDVGTNVEKMLQAAEQARCGGARLIVFSELCMTAYPPEDLLLRDDFIDSVQRQIQLLEAASEGIAMIVGLPLRIQGKLQNCACFFERGKFVSRYAKRVLPNYTVFDEQRYFVAGDVPCVVEVDQVCLGLIVCEDIWQPLPIQETKAMGAQAVISINASPFYIDKHEQRIAVLKQRATETQLPLIYVNQVGGQDELIFDGASCMVAADGEIVFTAPVFAEGLYYCALQGNTIVCDEVQTPLPELTELIWDALVLGIRDYIGKNEISGVVIGVSGGIDSALTLALAIEAVGADRVTAIFLPSQYTSDLSIQAARQLAANLKVTLHEININPIFELVLEQIAPLFTTAGKDITEENIQARIRSLLLMAVANKQGQGLLTTGNKSEMAVGYTTLYGDMAGAFAPLKDIIKRRVYELARWYNREQEIIPSVIIERAPTAELAPGQLDEDTLPPYELLDSIIELFIEKDASYEEIVAQGFASELVKKVQRMILSSEFKRRQSPLGVKVTSRAFGKDRRYPVTSGFKP